MRKNIFDKDNMKSKNIAQANDSIIKEEYHARPSYDMVNIVQQLGPSNEVNG